MTKKYIHPDDFRDLRRFSDLTRKQAADLLSVSVRTVQNWETGGARIPWMAYRMLRILRGYALPGKAWDGWSIHGDRLYAPNGRWYEANSLEQIEVIFGMARLWRKAYLSMPPEAFNSNTAKRGKRLVYASGRRWASSPCSGRPLREAPGAPFAGVVRVAGGRHG